MTRFAYLPLAVVLLSLTLAAQPYAGIEEPGRTLADMEPVLKQIAAWQYSQSHEPLFRFDEFLQGAQSQADVVKQVENRLIQLLPEATMAGKQYICRQLGLIGTDAAVPSIARLLAKAETNDMARYALERIPGEASAGALRDALKSTSGRSAVGVINSLGQLRDTKSVPVLTPLLTSSDAGIPEAAAAALAAIGDRPALNALSLARTGASGARRLRMTEAYLHCAARLADKTEALKVFRQLNVADESDMVRVAALGGIASAAGNQAIGELKKELASASPGLRSASIRLLNDIPGADITNFFIENFPKAPADAQVRIITALGNRGDESARPLVTNAVKSSEPAVRKAALVALGKIGDGTSVLVLAEAAGGDATVARESLNTARGSGVEKAIIASIGSAPEKPKLELIRAAGARGLTAAADVLLRASEDPSREVRREALRALRTTAGPEQSGALLALLVRAQDAPDRRDITNALAAAIKRSESRKVADVVGAYESAQSAPVRTSLLDVLGQVSSDDALPTLRKGLTSSDAEIVRASILALTEWQTPAPMPDLLEVAKNGADTVQQVLALRGYIKLISAPSKRTIPETVELIATAMEIAKQPEEARSLLALLPFYPTKKALALAEAASKDAAVTREARYAISRVRLALGALQQ